MAEPCKVFFDVKKLSKVAQVREVVLRTLSGLLGCEPEEVAMDEPFSTAGVTSMMHGPN